MNGRLPDYSACTYSLFVSYSHGDNEARGEYIAQMADALAAQLTRLTTRGHVKLGVHMSGKNGSTAGLLGESLKASMAKSYACLLVIDDGYANSTWCQRELQYFAELFGREGVKRRLYIAVLSEAALKRVNQRVDWKAFVADDIYWTRFYRPDQPGRDGVGDEPDQLSELVDAMGAGYFEAAFLKLTREISTPLLASILKNIHDTRPPPTVVGKPAPPVVNTPWTVEVRTTPVVGIGPCTKDMAPQVQALKTRLDNAGARVRLLERDLMYRYIFSSGEPLRSRLAELDLLVVPISDAEPLQPNTDGGHASLLLNEWTELKKPHPIVWYRPQSNLPESLRSEKRHLDVFARLGPILPTEQSVKDLLFGYGAVDPIKIRIEKCDRDGKHATPFFAISRALEEGWRKLSAKEDLPELICHQLDFKGVEVAVDALGVVILQPFEGGFPTRTASGINSKVRMIWDQFKQARLKFSNCVVVAVIYDKPEDRAHAENDYMHIHMSRPKCRLDDDDELDLEEFLSTVLDRYRESRNPPPDD